MVDKFSFSKENYQKTLFIIFNSLFLLAIALIILYPVAKVIADSLNQKASLTEFRLLPAILSYESYITILTRDFLYKPFLTSLYTTHR